MNLDEAKTLFENKGLFVDNAPQPYGKGLRIAGRVDRSSTIWCLNDITTIYIIDNESIIDTQESVPLPGKDEILYKVQSLDKAVDITLELYFGQPAILDTWIFPIQKHPDWNLEIIRESLMKAKTISNIRWQVLKQQYDKRFKRLFQRDNREQWMTLWEGHPELDFRKVESVITTKTELWMSRDTQRMYKVADEP